MPAQPQTVTIAQARLSQATGLLVLDTGADIVAALPDAALVSRVASFTLSGPALLTFPQMALLVPLGSKLHAAAGALQLTGACTMGVAQLTALEALPGFVVSQTGNIDLTDTTAQIVGMLAAHPAWFAQLNTITIQLDGSSLGAYPATQINGLITHGKTVVFVPSPGHTTLNVAAAAHDLATNAASLDSLESHQALSFTVTNDGSAISAVDAASLLTLQGFNPAAHTLTIADTGADISPRLAGLLGHGFGQILVTSGTLAGTAAQLLDPSVHYAAGSHAQLAGSASVSASVANALANLPGFSAAFGSVLTVSDTAANILALTPAALSRVNVTALSADATCTAEQAQALFADPGFTTGGHQFSVSDTATNLLGLPYGIQVGATLLSLSANQTVSASTLGQLAGLGIKFSENGHAVICQDTAANLAGLTQPALGLASAEVLGASATVSAATAASLAALPNFSTAQGVSLTVQDSVGNLIALGQGVPPATTTETLPAGTVVTVSASQAVALASLPHFSKAGAQITIADTVANLTAAGASVLNTVGSSVDVVDSAANLAASANTALVQNAAQDTLSGNAQVSAAVAAQLAAIPHFSAGPYQLTAADTAAHIASAAAAILPVASAVVVTDSGPVNAQTADALATLSAAGVLSFQGGDQLLVQDSYAALTNAANAPGIVLAARIGVDDTATNLVAASAHNWGALNPSYTLSQASTVSGAVATSLAALGSHFSTGGFPLIVADTAAGVIAAGNALAALSLSATVNDTAANVGADASALSGLGQAISAIHLTDSNPVSAATAAPVSALAGLLTGPALQVADTAAHVDANLASLAALHAHVAVHVTDTAADVATYAPDLASLGNQLVVSLTDTLPVTATVAAALSPIQASLAAGSSIGVADTAADIAAQAATLTSMLPVLGQISLSDGTVQSVSTVAALAPVDSHLPAGTMLTATGSTADVVANLAALTQLFTDGRLAAVQVGGATVADISAHVSALNALPAQVDVVDSAANVDAALATLAQLNGLQAISFSDAGTPALSMSVGTLAADAAVLAKITTPYTLTLSDTAAHIAADLSAGSNSVIASHLAQVGQVVVDDGQPLSLAQSLLLTPGIDDGPNSVLAKFTGSLIATNVDVAHLSSIAGLTHAPSGIEVADTSANLAADLAQGNASVILSDLPNLTGITSTDGQPITLDAAVALAPHIDDAAGSAVTLLSGAQLNITNATVADIPSLLALAVLPATVSVVDTAAAVSADLGSAQPSLVQSLPRLAAITVSDGQSISLTEAQLLAPGVDDGAGCVLSLVTGGGLVATDVAAADLGTVLALSVAPDHVSITDTAAHVVSNLASEIADLDRISEINIVGAPVTLTAAEALSPHVDDGTGSLIDLLTGHVFDVSGASIAQLAPLLALPDAPASVSITDSASNIVSDLTSSNSALATDIGVLGALTVTHGILTLTDAQAIAVLGSPALTAVLAHLVPATQVLVTGVPLADLSTVASSGWPHLAVNVSDSAANIANDLASQNSVLQAYHSSISGVSLTSGGTVDAASLASMANLPNFQTNGMSLSLQDTAAATLALPPATLSLAQSVAIEDSSIHVAASLDALQAVLSGAFSITLTNPSPVIFVTSTQYQADHAVLAAITNPGVTTVTGSAAAISQLAPTLASDADVSTAAVTDSAANVVGDLNTLFAAGSKLRVSLTDTSITANLVTPLLGIPAINLSGLPVVDTGMQIAAIVEEDDASTLAYLNTYGAFLADSSPVGAADAAALETLTGFHTNGQVLTVWDTAQHLTTAAYTAALNNSLVGAIYLKASNGEVSVSATTAASLFALPGFSTSTPTGGENQLYVIDSAPHLEGALATLAANRGAIAGISVSASSVISDQVLADLQGLNATTAPGVSLTVRDSAATIAANALTQSNGQSLVPVAWTLSSSATVSETTAAILGNIPNFSTAGFTLSLALTGDTVISVADANELGNLLGSLNLNGHHLVVAGSAAQLSALSPTALQLVTPELIDTAANVAALPANSPLLTGSVEITDGEPLTASTVTALLNLVHTTGPGILPSALTIDSVHNVVDTVTSLRTLLTSTGWTANQAEQADFNLVAQDGVNNLINPANAALLHSVDASTLPMDATVTASMAASLAAISTAIHFNRGSNHVIVQDTASNLLNPNYAAALTTADTILLAGPDHADAADAETLLSLPHFDLTVPLTIVDSSSNLLDGQLGGAIQASGSAPLVRIELAGPETLDAQTAAQLVALPGFADSQDLTISDDPSYLLNAASLAAEQMASTVTLASDEVVSTNTVLRLSEIPHFTPGGSHLVLASNDFASAATLKAVADMGSSFETNGHSITMTSDALDLTPAEFTALQSDNISHNGYQLGFIPTAVSVSDVGNILTVNGAGVPGGTVRLYAGNGTLLSAQTQSAAGFSVSTGDVGNGQNFALTEAGPGAGSEGAPLILLDTAALEAEVAAAGASFGSTGAIQVDTGKALNLYTAGAVPTLLQPALVYDPSAHTLSLDIPGQSSVTLLTLGTTTHPASLDASEIVFKSHG